MSSLYITRTWWQYTTKFQVYETRRGRVSGLAHCRNHPKLLEQTHLVWATPMLHDFATLEASHIQRGDGDFLASWRDALKLTSVGAVKGQASGNCIAFGNHLIDSQVPVRKGSVKDAD